MKRIAVLISGHGRNLQAILDATREGRIEGQVVGVISSREEAHGLERARSAGVASQAIPATAYADRAAHEEAVSEALERLRPDWIVLAGYMRILSDAFVRRYQGRMLNIHPSLLPRHPGLRTHERVLEAGDPDHGATVHFVSPEVDAGALVIQGRLMVSPQDTAASLAGRVMNEIELRIFPMAVAWAVRGDLRLDRDTVLFRGRPLAAALSLDDLEPGF